MNTDERSPIRVLALLQNGGLANRLFPWARATIFSISNNYPMLGVEWRQAKIGPTLRRERDKRLYLNMMCQHPRYIGGFGRRLAIARLQKLPEPELLTEPASGKKGIVVFSGLSDYFQSLDGHHELLRSELRIVTKRKNFPSSESLTPIVAHIRRSDFGARATPLSWFESSLISIRAAGIKEDIGIVTDGTDNEVSSLLTIPGVRMIRTGSAIGDLWAAGNARVLLGSEHSTFTAWASFLGQSVTAFHPSGDMMGLPLVNRNLVCELNPQDSSSDFLDQAKRSLRAREQE